MASEPAPPAVAAARQTLAQNRVALLRLAGKDARGDVFPRSATFRWLLAHLDGRALAATAVSAVLARPQFLQAAAAWLWSRRRRRPRR